MNKCCTKHCSYCFCNKLILIKKITGFPKKFQKTCSAENKTLGSVFYIKNINLKAEFFKEYFLFHFKNKLVL